MKIDLIECTVRITYDGHPNLTEIVKAGASAVPASEIPLLRALHDTGMGDVSDCCIGHARKVGEFETTKANEIERIRTKFKKGLVDMIYPAGRGMAATLEDCELPSEALAKRSTKKPSDRDEAAAAVQA